MENTKLLRLPQVLEFVGFKKSKLWRMVSNDQFPQPIKLSSRITVWIESEVNQWINMQITNARQ